MAEQLVDVIMEEGRATALDRSSPRFLNNLGAKYLQIGALGDARRCFTAALACDQQYAIAHFNLGSIYDQEGQLAEARVSYEEAVQLNPQLYQAWVRLAQIAERENNMAALRDAVSHAHLVGAGTPEVCFVTSLLARREGNNALALQMLDQALAEQRENTLYLFHKGYAYEALGHYNDAFACFMRANQTLPVNPQDKQMFFQDGMGIIQLSNQLPTQPQMPIDRQWPVCIVGCPCSGTGLLAQLLGRHSALHYANPLPLGQRVYERACAHLELQPAGANMVAIVRALWIDNDVQLLEVLRETAQTVLADVAPSGAWLLDAHHHNAMLIGILAKVMPGAAMLHMVRDGREAAFAMFKQHFAHTAWYKTHPGEAVTYWASLTHIIQASLTNFGVPFYEVRCEALVREPRATLESALSWLQLPWDDACMQWEHDYSAPTRMGRAASADIILHPSCLDTTRQHYPDHFAELGRLGQDCLREQGYDVA